MWKPLVVAPKYPANQWWQFKKEPSIEDELKGQFTSVDRYGIQKSNYIIGTQVWSLTAGNDYDNAMSSVPLGTRRKSTYLGKPLYKHPFQIEVQGQQ